LISALFKVSECGAIYSEWSLKAFRNSHLFYCNKKQTKKTLAITHRKGLLKTLETLVDVVFKQIFNGFSR